jgi:hypothetical protein
VIAHITYSQPPVAVRSRQGYHSAHATQLDTHWPPRGALPHRSQYHSAYTGCDGHRPNRVDALSYRMPARSCGLRMDWMGLDRHGLRHLWNGGIGVRPCHSDEHPKRARRNRRLIPLQCHERDRELFTDLARWARVLPLVPGNRPSRIPPSQSSVPFFIRKTLIRSNPASVNQALVSATE